MKLIKLTLALLLLSIGATGSLAKADVPTVHGMVLFGGQETYASHLPMFHAPHDYQLLLKVALKSKATGSPMSLNELKAKGISELTIAPKPMDLTQVIAGKITQFEADLFHGHFERGGQLLEPVIVTVEKQILSKRLDPVAPKKNEYLVFGGKGEYFALHLINAKPSFDLIMSVSQPYNLPFPHCRTRACADPVPQPIADHQLPLTLEYFGLGSREVPKTGYSIGGFGQEAVDVLQTLYFEKDELSH